MNILVVVENFTMGGLETYIYTQYSALKNTNNFVFAFGNYDSKYTFDDSKIYTGFNFKRNSTIGEFCDDVDKLVDIINDNNIDIIHSHPFFPIFPAVIASQITEKPLVYTYHGFSSYSFTNSNLQILLFNHFLENCINIIFCNSMTGEHFLKEHNNLNNIVSLPNSIDIKLYKKHKVLNNKCWALISRLDEDKYPEIIKLLQVLKDLDIEKICIYGDGSERTKIEEYVTDNNLTDKVDFMGFCADIYTELDGKYNGIIGIGRVVMEGLAMGYPTLIIGQNKISGIIDKEVFLKIKDHNFVNRLLTDITLEELNQQLSKVYKNTKNYNLSSEINKEFSSENISNKYLQTLFDIKFNKSLGIVEFYKELEKIKDESSEFFYESRHVYDLFKNNIGLWVLTSNVKNIITVFDNYYKLLDKQQNDKNILLDEFNTQICTLNDKINQLDNKTTDLENKINILSNRLNSLSLWKSSQLVIKRTISNFINKIKKH